MAFELLSTPSRATDGNGSIYSGAKWKFYDSGTTTPRAVYSDATLVTSLGSTVTADSGGKFPAIYFDAEHQYRGVCENASGSVTIHDIDPINAGVFSQLSATTGAALVGVDTAGLGASAANMQEAINLALGESALSFTNPSLDGGLIGLAPDGNNTKTSRRLSVSLTGSRTKARAAQTIEVSDNQSGPASSSGSPTPDSASYALSLVNYRPSWNTSGATGEADGLNVFIRQANSDAAGILTNVVSRSGFAASLEGYTGSADAAGAILKAVNVQLCTVNSRDGGEYGIVVQATTGTGLSAGVSARELGTATWTNAFEFVNAAGTALWYVRSSDGACIGNTFAPRADAGGDIGADALRFNTGFFRQIKTSPYTVALLPTVTSNAGMRALVSDSTVAATGNFGAVVAGGGANIVPVWCDGSNWRIG